VPEPPPAAVPEASFAGQVMTVTGPIRPEELGVTLMHEHVLVDFVGADKVDRARYDAEAVFQTALPYLQEVVTRGGQAFVDCTPAYLGRDPVLLKRLAEASGLRILTNTGYYGAGQNKYLPAHALTETADELAARWSREFREGIEGTGVRPGLIKTGVDKGPLSEIHRKLITAAARCHRATGLPIHVHTGDGAAAKDIVKTLGGEGVPASAYVWVHAQNEPSRSVQMAVAETGAFVELDGLAPGDALERHVEATVDIIGRGQLPRLLVSQDAGWYHVGEPGGGTFRGYALLFDEFLPALRERGIPESQIRALLVTSPARALTLRAPLRS
jgi:phosphotriesterase-related protein